MGTSSHKKAGSDPLIPSKTPFGYNVGVNYESWEVGRTGYSIDADLDQIYQNFRLVRTYHDAGVGGGSGPPTIDPTQAEVIDWIVAHPGVELVMGTNNNALAQGGFGDPWSAGLMTTSAYTDAWVQMLIGAFGSVDKVKVGLKAILLGNELDQNGPPPGDADFDSYVDTWIPAAFDNLKASMAAAGLGSIPISTTIANYGVSNVVSVKVPAYIAANWGDAWNNGEPFVMFNQYTADNQSSTDFAQVEQYFESVEAALGGDLEVFVGETGYSTYWGAANQTQVYDEIFAWLSGQEKAGGKTVPLFFFDAFDRPAATPADQVAFGIYDENAQHRPTGLKTNLDGVIPAWTTQSITLPSKNSESLYGSSQSDRIEALAGDDIVLGFGGGDMLFGQTGSDLLLGHAGRDALRGGRGDDVLYGGKGHDILVGCYGRDQFSGGRGKDVFVLTGLGTDTIHDFKNGADRFHLARDLRFGKLDFVQAGDDAEIRIGSKVVAVVESVDAALLGREDFLVL